MANFLFYFFGTVSVISALFVVSAKKPIYCVLALVVTMFALSGIFVSLNAHFVAALQILIYAGAILVLFLFVLMLLGTEGADYAESGSKVKFVLKSLLAFAFVAEILIFVHRSRSISHSSDIGFSGSIETVGRLLFSDYILAFELISILLLVGVVGVVHLTRKEKVS